MNFCIADSVQPWPFSTAYKSSIQIQWEALCCSLNSKLWSLEAEAIITTLFPFSPKYQWFGVADMGPGPHNNETMCSYKLQTVLAGTRNWRWGPAFHYLSNRISFCGKVSSLWPKSKGKVEICLSKTATGKPSKEREAWAQVPSPNTVCLLFNNCLM